MCASWCNHQKGFEARHVNRLIDLRSTPLLKDHQGLAPVPLVETKIPADLFVLFQIPIMLTKHISREMEIQLMQPKRITKQRTLTFVPSWPFNQV